MSYQRRYFWLSYFALLAFVVFKVISCSVANAADVWIPCKQAKGPDVVFLAWGTAPDQLVHVKKLAQVGNCSSVFSKLKPGTYYFRAFSMVSTTRSELSNIMRVEVTSTSYTVQW
jgi:hypothetical protein